MILDMVGEIVYHLQSLTFHCNGGLLVRLARCWLINHLGLFDADCEVRVVTGARYLFASFLLEHPLQCHQQRGTRLAPLSAPWTWFAHFLG